MNVLSLFDGMSCGQVALKRAGIKVDSYFASEVDKYAIKVTKNNFPKTYHLGDVRDIGRGPGYLPKINLVLAGSPCQGFSYAGKQLNFIDPKSILFFDFIRIIKCMNPEYFLLENVMMKKEYRDVISEYMGVEPIVVNSNLVSAQNRKRLYWTNIPFEQPEDRGILLKDILITDGEPTCYSSSGRGNGKVERRMSSNEKAHTLTASGYSNRSFTGVIEPCGLVRKLDPIECERLQTLEDNYTCGVSDSQRYKMLGNGWTVDVISHILKGIKGR